MTAFKSFNEWLSSSITVKLCSIGFLTLILLIPGVMIQSLISERQSLSLETEKEISLQWGGEQLITGPILMIPFDKTDITDGKKTISRELAYVLPESLKVDGSVFPDIRYRGIYSMAVYNAKINLKGSFVAPDWASLGIDESTVVREEAAVIIGIPDMRGIRNSAVLDWGDKKFIADPGLKSKHIAESGLNIKVDLSMLKDKSPVDFSILLDLNGSDALSFIPVGKETNVNINSSWPDPSFNGSFLPDKRTINSSGFQAHWNVLHLNRNFPQQWIGSSFDTKGSAFGVRFIIPVDHYQKTMRSAKYAVMFLALTFAVFFFVEVINHKRIHPIQYLFVGLGLSLFYALLLSISEQLPFNLAFAISASAIIIMVTLYSRAIFKKRKLVLLMAGFLIALYGFLYILLQLEDYALLIGSVGLFAILGIIMYLSRNINWFQPMVPKENVEGDVFSKNV
jgi:inner membrane protein